MCARHAATELRTRARVGAAVLGARVAFAVRAPLVLALAVRVFAAPVAPALGVELTRPARASQQPLAPRVDGARGAELDAAARAEGERLLARAAEAAGGIDAWRAQGGAAWDVLETLRVEPEPGGGTWRVHSRVPRRAVFDATGQGWIVSEYARYDTPSRRVLQDLRREVAHNGAAWAETSSGCDRGALVAERARDALRREFLLGAPPFAWLECGAEARALGPAQLGEHAALRVALHLSTPLVVETSERISDFELWLDARTFAPLRLGYELRGDDRDDPARTSTRAWIEYSGRIACGKVFLPARRDDAHEGGPRRTSHELAAVASGTPQPVGLRRPWISGVVWRDAPRARSFDPPAPRAAESNVDGAGAGAAAPSQSKSESRSAPNPESKPASRPRS